MKIEVYSTFSEAEQELRKYYVQNSLALYGIYHQLMGIAQNFENSMVKTEQENKEALVLDFNQAISLVGRGEKIIMPLKLYNGNFGYGFDINYMDGEVLNLTEGAFTSINELVEAVREQISGSFVTRLGASETQLFYTIAEPYHFSEEEKKAARAEYDFEHMTPENQDSLNVILETYTEYGLEKEERKEFERGYFRFFN